ALRTFAESFWDKPLCSAIAATNSALFILNSSYNGLVFVIRTLIGQALRSSIYISPLPLFVKVFLLNLRHFYINSLRNARTDDFYAFRVPIYR
ncbi:MAG: hypothetical protein LBM60_08120, partial [Clostridium sp.]|nr:hypothetical protein [Clostridium sp.]